MANRGKTYASRRKKRPSKSKFPKSFIILLVLVILCLGAVYALSGADKPTQSSASPSGISPAQELEKVIIPDETPSIIKEYTGFTVNFNPS